MINNLGGNGDGQYGSYSPNVQAMQEVALGLGTHERGAFANGGVNINYIPREGSNAFSGLVDVAFGNGDTQWSNLNDEIPGARRFSTAAEARKLWDYALNAGGPLARDRLWFFAAARWWGGQEYAPGNYYNKLDDMYIGDPNSGVVNYEPDLEQARVHRQPLCRRQRPADVAGRAGSQAVLGLQLSEELRLQPLHRLQHRARGECQRKLRSRSPDERQLDLPRLEPAAVRGRVQLLPRPEHPQARREHHGPRRRRSRGCWARSIVRPGYFVQRAGASAPCPRGSTTSATRSSSRRRRGRRCRTSPARTRSRPGVQMLMVHEDRQSNYGDAASPGAGPLRPSSTSLPEDARCGIRQIASPHLNLSDFRDVGLYVQDQLTIDRLTINGGVRYDSFRASIPQQTRPAGPYVPAIPISAIGGDALPSYNSVVPRVGAAYDLFGDGTTAIKASFGKYVSSVGSNLLLNYHPALRISTIANRTWSDANMNFVPDCDLTSAGAERRMRRTGQRAVRPGPRGDRHRSGPAERGPGAQLAGDGRPGAADHRRVGRRGGLRPHLVRRLPGHRQPRGDAGRLRPVLCDGAPTHTRACPTAGATRSAACTTSIRRCSAGWTTT